MATASDIVEAGIKEPDIFELVGLFEENIGADRVSDMIVSIILPDILAYTRRVADNLGVETMEFRARGEEFDLPYVGELTSSRKFRRRPIILFPREIVRPLPVAYDWDDIDVVSAHNREVRQRVNNIIGNTWKRATSRNVGKRKLRDALLKNPELFRDLLTQYRKKSPSQYDFTRDPEGELIWADIARAYVEQYPLELDVGRRVTAEDLQQIVLTICGHFRRLVENNGMYTAFHNDSGKRRHERFAQLLFFAVADAYCIANNLDLDREPNASRGPVDFKLSQGYKAKVNVEVKYSNNSKLIDGFTKQLEIYNQAERSHYSVYLVIRTTESTNVIDALIELRSEKAKQGDEVPELIVVDGRPKPPASKA